MAVRDKPIDVDSESGAEDVGNIEADANFDALMTTFDSELAQRKLAKTTMVVNCAALCEDVNTTEENPASLRCDLCHRWSHVVCIEEQFGLKQSALNLETSWVCPGRCDKTPLWDDTL